MGENRNSLNAVNVSPEDEANLIRMVEDYGVRPILDSILYAITDKVNVIKDENGDNILEEDIETMAANLRGDLY